MNSVEPRVAENPITHCGNPNLLKKKHPTLAGGLIQFQVTGLNGATAVIEATSSLNPPNWQPVATNLIVNGTVTFSYSVTAAPRKFFRARLQ